MSFTGGASICMINGVTYINGQYINAPGGVIISGNSTVTNIVIDGDVGENASIKTTSYNNVTVKDIKQGAKIDTSHHCRVDVNAKHESAKIDSDHHCNVNVYTNFSDLGRQSFSSNSFYSGISSSDSENNAMSRSNHIPQRQQAQSTAPSMEVDEDLPPSYEEVVGSGAAAATGLPPAYSETPQEGETSIANNLSGSTISNPLNSAISREFTMS